MRKGTQISKFGASKQNWLLLTAASLLLFTPTLQASAVESNKMSVGIIFLAELGCTELDSQKLLFYADIAQKYLLVHGYKSNIDSDCIGELDKELLTERYNSALRMLENKRLIVVVTNNFSSPIKALQEYSTEDDHPNFGLFTQDKDRYAIVVKDFETYDDFDAAWTLSHELAHMILFHEKNPEYVRGVHRMQSAYDKCLTASFLGIEGYEEECEKTWFQLTSIELGSSIDYQWYRVMRIDDLRAPYPPVGVSVTVKQVKDLMIIRLKGYGINGFDIQSIDSKCDQSKESCMTKFISACKAKEWSAIQCLEHTATFQSKEGLDGKTVFLVKVFKDVDRIQWTASNGLLESGAANVIRF